MLRTLKQQVRSVRVVAEASGELRRGTLHGKEHIIVPVVMLMEGVVWPFAQPDKELVLASELEKAEVRSWNGRPIVMDHPSLDGRAVPANIPEVLENYQIGLVFNAAIKKKKLTAEAWLDLERLQNLNDDSRTLLTHLENNEMVEVSVGTYITAEENSGTYDGEEYAIIWRDIVPEHLAMLPDGTIGACSNEMGCGASRVAKSHTHRMNSANIVIEERDMPAPVAKTLTQRVLEAFKLRTAAVMETGQSSSELNQELWNLLYSEEAAFQGIWEVYPEDNIVVYAVAPGNEFHLYRRKYASSDGKVSLTGVRKEVEPVTRYETMSGEEPAELPTNPPTAASAAPCGCNGGTNDMKTMKERASVLITSSRNKFTEADRPALEGLAEPMMKALEEAETLKTPEEVEAEKKASAEAAKREATPPAPPADPPAPADTVTLSKAEYNEFQGLVAAKKAEDAAEQAELIRVCSEAQTVYTPEDLKKMDLATLRKTADLLKVRQSNVIAGTDFSARGLSNRRVGTTPDDTVPAAKPMAERFARKETAAK